MTSAQWIELIGYVGSFLVLVSFLMVSVVKLRLVNTVGSVIFTVYALIIHSYPTAVMNACLVLINVHFLWKMTHNKAQYELVKVQAGDAMLAHILTLYREDIEKCFPGNSMDFAQADHSYVVFCGSLPVGVTLGKEDNGTLELLLDYSVPEYRDFSIGDFIISKLPEDGIKKLVYRGNVENHKAYLFKMGFSDHDGVYEKDLA
jgi:hypothetical protein